MSGVIILKEVHNVHRLTIYNEPPTAASPLSQLSVMIHSHS